MDGAKLPLRGARANADAMEPDEGPMNRTASHAFLCAMDEITFALRDEHIELNQLLKLAGVCDSGGQGKQLVAEGRVKVDGQVELRKTNKIRAGQVVECGRVRITVVAQGPGDRRWRREGPCGTVHRRE